MTTQDVHAAASAGYKREASTYERGRPEYPQALGGWLRDTMRCGPGATAVDVGAGTGKFTKLVAATGAKVVAVEPVDEMRAKLAGLHGVEALAGTAQHLPLERACADAIVCAQAFHWFAHGAGAGRVRPRAEGRGPAGACLERARRVGGLGRGHHAPHHAAGRRRATLLQGDWRKPVPHPAFTALEETRFTYEHTGSPQEVIVDRFMSVSFIASAPPADRDHVRSSLEQLIADASCVEGQGSSELPLPDGGVSLRARRPGQRNRDLLLLGHHAHHQVGVQLRHLLDQRPLLRHDLA